MAAVVVAVGSDNDCDHSGMQCWRRGYGVLVGIVVASGGLVVAVMTMVVVVRAVW